MTALIQRSFAGGIISPQLFGRVDQNKYATGLQKCLNFVVQRFGGVENRSGTVYDATAKESTYSQRLIKFVSISSQGLLLEFGNDYIRFFKNGAPISVVPANAAAWDLTKTYQPGDNVIYLSVYYVALVTSTNVIPSSDPTKWKLVLMDWSNVAAYAVGDLVLNASDGLYYYCKVANTGNRPDLTPADWYVQPGTSLEIPTVIPSAALASMQFVQLNDVMILTSQSFYPQQLNHFSDTSWTIGNFATGTGVSAPTGVGVVAGNPPAATVGQVTGLTAAGGLGGSTDGYVVTAFKNPVSAEGPSSAEATSTVGQATGANPVALSWIAVAGATGYAIYKSINPGSAGGPWYIIGVSNSTAFSDNGITIGKPIKGAPTGSGSSTTYTYVVTSIDADTGIESVASSPASAVGGTPSPGAPNVISWSPVSGASSYNVYENVSGVYSFVGSSSTTSFNDTNIIPDQSKQPPVAIGLFQTTNDYPAVVGAYQQRLCFANTLNQPQTVWCSATASYNTFTSTVPVLDSGAIQFTIAGRQIQEVRALVDLGALVIHTSSGEYVAKGNQFQAITPTQINLVQQGYAGSQLVVPVSIGNTDLFIQARGTILRDLRYEIQSTAYTGKDTTVFAPHLFFNTTITRMDWQQVLNSIVWVVLDNGKLLGLTYLREHDIWGWHEHDTTAGVYKDVCVVPEGSQDVVYVLVQRTINGSTVNYIEHFANRDFTDIATDAIFCDSCLTYDGRNTTTHTMRVTTGAGWTPQDTLTITASAATFSAGDVGNAIVFQQLDTDGTVLDTVTFSLIGYTSTTVMTCQADQPVPTWARVALATWGKAVHTFTGMNHLEGEALAILGDGNVVAPPAPGSDAPQIVVSGGAFSTGQNYLVLQAGLPIVADFQTLDIENTQGETILNKRKLINEVCVLFYNSRGGYFGMDADHLYSVAQRGGEDWNEPNALITAPLRIGIQGTWQKTGQVFIRQVDPLPMGISAVVPTGFVGN